jgi:hypothetical protein
VYFCLSFVFTFSNVSNSGLYLKENGEHCDLVSIPQHHTAFAATEVSGTFRVSGSNRRMRELQASFETPPRVRSFAILTSKPSNVLHQYGKNLDWKKESYTTHDVASVFRRYLTQMPVRNLASFTSLVPHCSSHRNRSYPTICTTSYVRPCPLDLSTDERWLHNSSATPLVRTCIERAARLG